MALAKKLTIADLTPAQLKGKTVIIRVDFNVPFGKDGKISNTKRITATLPTLDEVFAKGAKKLVLLSHLGRPNGKVDPASSLKPVAEKLQELYKKPVTFVPECIGPKVEAAIAAAGEGAILLLENVRFHIEEEGSATDDAGKKTKATKEAIEAFSAALTKLGDVYINDAFGTAHRAHASMVGINLPIKAAGKLIKTELDAFLPIIEQPAHPLLAILGGAKVTDKIKLIKNLLDKVDEMIITGGMAFTFLKQAFGVKIGKSLYDEEGAKIVDELLAKAKAKNVKILLMEDFTCADSFSETAAVKTFTKAEGIPDGWLALDAGPKTVALYKESILKSKAIIWNGPAGKYEWAAFQAGTKGMMEACAEAKAKGALVVIGGGDCGACADNWGFTPKLSHVSTGGGASLELLEGVPLPGLYALSDKA